MGIREGCPLFQYRGWGKRSDGIAPDRENEQTSTNMPRDYISIGLVIRDIAFEILRKQTRFCMVKLKLIVFMMRWKINVFFNNISYSAKPDVLKPSAITTISNGVELNEVVNTCYDGDIQDGDIHVQDGTQLER